ncbi:MAG: radical SAM family heme chaperone HemW [Athalassotoga sp.]|uniref:radical SAM family heme chaperone HemW n=1 Tax=Athalassotoga sp. TaxID=2022597 RepID=UPI003D01144B
MKTKTSLYVHVPFCSRKCVYCDFTSVVNDKLISSYFEAIEKEVDLISSYTEPVIFTIYFGGGTPSHVNVDYISKLMKKIESAFEINAQEITLEMNPEDVTDEKCRQLKFFGVNRISLGLQSSSNEILRVIGRPYTLENFLKRYDTVRKHFDNVNIDLIYNLPFERLSDVESDLRIIEKTKPDHVSFYELELHEETPLYSMVNAGVAKLPSEEVSEMMYDTIIDGLEDLGYKRYELSSWTLEKPSIHNINYWQNGQYIGIGVSAGSHIGTERSVNLSDINEYLSKIRSNLLPREYHKNNTLEEEIAETIFMGLRLAIGINEKDLRAKFGSELTEIYLGKLDKFKEYFLENKDGFLRFTKDGMKFSALVLSELV